MSSDPPVSGERSKQFEGQAVTRGLPSVSQAREERRKLRWLPPRFWLWAMVCVGAGIIVWWKIDQGEINTMRGELLARQRGVVAELGPRWFPLRDKILGWTAECGVGAFVETVDEDLSKTWDFRKMPGIYLRLAQQATKSPEAIRDAAGKSLRDGFTSCLFLVDNPNPLGGPECLTTADCPRGQLCNEYSRCAEHSQPFNLRLAYKSLHVMSDDWVADVQSIGNKLTLRGAVATFDAVSEHDLPVAADLLARSKYFLVVVDEPVDADAQDVDSSLPEIADAGAEDDRSIPTAAHPARVCLWRLEDGKKMLALRRDAAGVLRGPAGADISIPTRIAQRRQANSCALALAVREAIGADPGARVPDEEPGSVADAGAPDSGAASAADAGAGGASP